MNKRYMFVLLSLIVTVSMILSACGAPATEAPATEEVVATEAPTEEPTAEPTPEEQLEAKKNFGTYFMNSLFIASIAAFFVTLFSAMAGYVFAKKELPYKQGLFQLFMVDP